MAETMERQDLRRLRLTRPHECEHPWVADRSRPELSPWRGRSGAAPCALWEPRGPPDGTREALSRLRVMIRTGRRLRHRRTHLEWSETATPSD